MRRERVGRGSQFRMLGSKGHGRMRGIQFYIQMHVRKVGEIHQEEEYLDEEIMLGEGGGVVQVSVTMVEA